MIYRILLFVVIILVLGAVIYLVDQNRQIVVYSEMKDSNVLALFLNPSKQEAFWRSVDREIQPGLRKRIYVSILPETVVLNLSSKNQEQARQTLMAVVRVLEQVLIQQQQEEKSLIQKESEEHLRAWNTKEKQLLELQITHDLLKPQIPFEQKEKTLADLLSKKEERFRKINGDLDVLKTLEKNENFSLNYLDIDVPSAKKYREMDQIYQALKSRYKSKHPKIIEYQSELDLLRQSLFQELVDEKSSLDAQLLNLRMTLETLRADHLKIVPIREKLSLLKVEIERHRKEYQETAAKYELYLSQSLPRFSYSLKDKKDVAALKWGVGGFVGSLCLALLALLFIFYFDRRVYHPKHVYKAHKDFTLLGVTPMPRRDEPGPLVAHQYPNSSFSKSLQTMRNRLLSQGRGHQVILVTSASRSSSSISIVANLAISLAQVQKKVLLIDCRFSDPRQHRFFKLKNKGLAHLLRQECGVEEVLQKVEIPHLTVIPSGEGLGLKLLQSEAFRTYLNTFKSEFDFVFLDAPPLSSGTEAALIGREMDGIILTVSSGEMTQEQLRWTKQELELSGTPLLGLVLKECPTMPQGTA